MDKEARIKKCIDWTGIEEGYTCLDKAGCKELADDVWREAQLNFIDTLNHNKRKIFIDEDRDINEIFLDLKFLRGLVE